MKNRIEQEFHERILTRTLSRLDIVFSVGMTVARPC